MDCHRPGGILPAVNHNTPVHIEQGNFYRTEIVGKLVPENGVQGDLTGLICSGRVCEDSFFVIVSLVQSHRPAGRWDWPVFFYAACRIYLCAGGRPSIEQ